MIERVLEMRRVFYKSTDRGQQYNRPSIGAGSVMDFYSFTIQVELSLVY
jgi:hypothetical protein